MRIITIYDTNYGIIYGNTVPILLAVLFASCQVAAVLSTITTFTSYQSFWILELDVDFDSEVIGPPKIMFYKLVR